MNRLLRAAVSALLVLPLCAFGGADPVAEAKKLSSPLLLGANDWSCKPSAAHPRPVILVHGTFGSGGVNWSTASPILRDRGYCVFSLDHGTKPGAALAGLAPAATSAAQVATFVDGVLKATGAAKADLLSYSFGGVVARYYLRFLGGAAKVGSYVGLGPTSHGTTPEGIFKLAGDVVGAFGFLFTSCDSCRDQMTGSPLLTKLNEGRDTEPGVDYTVIATRYDEVVTPYQSQFLTGSNASNVTLQDLCAVNFAEHLSLTSSPLVLHEVLNVLDPSRVNATNCFSWP